MQYCQYDPQGSYTGGTQGRSKALSGQIQKRPAAGQKEKNSSYIKNKLLNEHHFTQEQLTGSGQQKQVHNSTDPEERTSVLMKNLEERGQKEMAEHKKKLMTYEQWKRIYKKHLRKKAIDCLYCFLTFALFIGAPFGMFFHWLIIGY